jgi:hypothetical protein
MRSLWLLTATAALGIAGIVGAPTAAALPECAIVAPQTMQCERGTHVGINSSPNVLIYDGPYFGQPWIYSYYPGFGIGDWAVP